MRAAKGALVSGVLAVMIGLGGCALVVGNEIGNDAWGSDYAHDFKEETRSDRELSRRVQRALNQDVETRRAGLRVRSRNGEVLLVGRTGDAEVVGHAMRVVLAVDGVEQVTSRVELIDSR